MLDLSILIVNYNTKDLLRACLKSIEKQVHVSHEVIVVDNASSDSSAEVLPDEFPNVHFILSPDNLGFAAGNNLGLTLAKGEFCFCLNPDTELIDDSLDKLVARLKADKTIGIGAPKLLYGDGSLQRSIRPFYTFWGSLFDNRFMNPVFSKFPTINKFVPVLLDHSKSSKVDWVKGAAFLIRTDLMKQINGFDEQFWIYGEEMDLCMQVWKAGYSIQYYHDLVIMHYEGQSTRQSSEKMFIQNYKSFYLFLKKNYPKKSLRLYHFRTMSFGYFWLFKATISNNKAHKTLYTSLLKWIKTDGKQLAA